MAQLTVSQPVDVIASVDPYDATRPDWVGVDVETTPDGGRYVHLVSPGGKVEFRIPADNADLLAEAIRDAAHGDLTDLTDLAA